MADIALSVASKAAEYVVAPVCRRCGYVIFANSYVGELKKQLVQLENARQRVQHSVDEARNNMKLIEADVDNWLEEVETVSNNARDLLDNDVRAKKTCFCGWLPNPKDRYCLGREARRTAEDVQALIVRSRFEKVYYENAPPGVIKGAPSVISSVGDQSDTVTDSRASIFQGIMEALDDEKLKVIGVYGPGGVGKTTLLEEVEKKVRKEGRPFHMIVKAKVSQTPDLKKIQDEIADALKLDLKDLQSEHGRANRLMDRLRRDPSEKVLVILDDLWDRLDLKAVGIPSGEESRGCKLLLSSRYKDAVEQKMHADRTFRLEGLNNDEAFRLFEKTVGDKLKDEEELKPIADQVVKKLAGLPLLIISVATTLKYSNAYVWRNALIKIDESNIETIVRLSYDHLKSEDAKSLFLLCSLIGGTIRVEILLVLSMGLGLFEGFHKTMEDARDRLNTTLDELRSACLLLDGGKDKENVVIHDLYSEVVVSTPFRGQNSLIMNNNSWSKEKLEKCWAICLTDVGSDRLAELMRHGFPELKVLMLSQSWFWWGHRDVGDCCRLDFTSMEHLQVLYIRLMNIPTLPSSIKNLENLRSLYLDCCDVEDVAIVGKLKALQILSFAGSAISKLPKEIGDLTNLKSLNLRNCHKLANSRLPKEIGDLTNLRLLNLNYCKRLVIEAGVLQGLINLEELYMKGSFDRWMGKDEIPLESCNARLVELKSLTRLTALEISIHDPTILLEPGDLPFGNLSRFWIDIGGASESTTSFNMRVDYERKVEGLRTMMLKLKGCDGILSKEWVQKTLHKTQYLHLEGLGESEENARTLCSAQELCPHGFPQLEHLVIWDSPSIEYIASSSGGILLTTFTRLESLYLYNLVNLEEICHGPVAPECLSKLKDVNIRRCGRLKYLRCLSQMQRFAHLEKIQVSDCESMRAIVTAVDDIVEFPNVRRLDLSGLPSMMSFCIGAGITVEGAPIQVSFPRLESLTMEGLLDLEKVLYSRPPLRYTNLKSIVIRGSQSTSSILKSDWIPKLPNLESLEIVGCESTKAVFDLEELKVMGRVEILPQLTELILRGLPDLQHMWKHDGKLQGLSVFPNLKKVHVIGTGLAFLFPWSVAKCLREIIDIRLTNCGNMETVIIDEEGRDGGIYDIIEFPKLERLDILGCPTKKFFSCPSGKKELVTTASDSHDAYSDSSFDQKVKLPNIRSLRIRDFHQCKELWNNQIPDDSFCKLEYLELNHCWRLQRVAPSHMWKRLHRSLDFLQVASCSLIEIIYEGDDTVTKSGKLRRLVLVELKNLRHIWQSDGLPNVPFPSLRFIRVWRCPRLRMLFPTFTPEFIGQIQEMVVESCEDMELIAGHEECDGATGTAITVSELIAVRLFELPKFRSFLPEKYSVEFPSLQVSSRVSCGTKPDQSLGDWRSYELRRQREMFQETW